MLSDLRLVPGLQEPRSLRGFGRWSLALWRGPCLGWPSRVRLSCCSNGMEPDPPTIRVIVRGMVKTVVALAVAASLLGSPLGALFCDGSGAVAMGCCKDAANHCNNPGANDECCRKVPADRNATNGPSHVYSGRPKRSSNQTPEGIAPVASLVVSPRSTQAPASALRSRKSDLALPSLFVLRI